MKFVYPEFLWGFLLLAIPVIIHLFNFKRYKTLFFSSLQFVKHVDQQTKSTQKLRHYLILASRLLAFTFLILAFAQPYFHDTEEIDNEKQNVILMYIDNSFSMEAKGSEGQLISQAREKAKEIVTKADLNSLFIVGTNEMTGIEERALNKAEALERIDNIVLSPLSRSVDEIVNWQTEAFHKNFGDPGQTQYILFSDFQFRERKKQQLGEQKGIEFYPVQLISETTENIYIDSVWYSAPVHKQNTNSEINIRVKNTGDRQLENLELLVNIGDLKKNIFVNVEPTGESTTSFTYREKEAGWRNGVLTIADDNLHFDDKYFISYEVHNSANVLILNGEDQINNFSVVYNLDEYYKVKEKDLSALVLDDFKGIDIVLINGANSVSSGLTEYLTNFLSTGGTVALFPGTNAETNGWNGLLAKIGLDGMGPVVSSGNSIDQLAYEDNFFKGVFDRKPERLNLPSVSKTYQSNSGKGITLIKLKNGMPLLSYSANNGLAFCFYSSVNEKFGNFANDALFSTILLRIGELSKRTQPLSLTIGEDAKYPIYIKNNSESPLHMKNANSEFIPEISETGGVTYIGINKIGSKSLLADNYSVFQNKDKVASISLNYNRDESLSEYLKEQDIKSLFSSEINKVNTGRISSTEQFSTKDIDKPFSYWKICIIFTIIFVIAEMLIVRLFK